MTRPPKKKTILESAIDFIEDLAIFGGSIFGTNSTNYCDIETSDGSDVLVTRSGNLLSGIRINGINKVVGPEEFEATCENLRRILTTTLGAPGHVVQFWFQRDTDGVRQNISDALHPSRETAKRLNLSLEDLLDSKEDHLPKYCSSEKILVGVWTNTNALPKQTQADIKKSKSKDLAKTPGVLTSGMQNLVAAIPDLRDVHESVVKAILEELKGADFFCEIMDSHEMLREIRLAISPSVTPSEWKPCLPGDPIPRMPRGIKKDDISELGYPPVSWQLFPQEMTRSENRKYLIIGETAYAPLYIEIPPNEIMPFSRLFGTAASSEIPWRISFIMEGGGTSSISFKAMMASFLTWAGAYNRKIDESVRALTAAEFEGQKTISLRIALCTWAPADKLNVLSDRVARLSKAVASWGNAEVRDVTGDSMLGFVSSLPFLTLKTVANPSVAPIEDAVRLLPVDRLSSFWKNGGVVFRTMDGRVIPFEPGSSLQSTWTYLFFARPGMGKSVLMASINLASCIAAGIERLPMISYIDIGPSSQGFIELIKDALPAHMKHMAMHFKLRMTKDYAVNAFDTQLGLRYPLPDEKSFLVDFLTLLATPAERTTPYDSISQLAGKVIDEAYRIFADTNKSKPKIYTRGISAEVDETLDKLRIFPEKGTSWWELVDLLFKEDMQHIATIAQRYAVPTLEDIAAIAQMPAIGDLYGNVRIESGEQLNAAFSRLLADAVREFPVLASETRFDIGDARILAVDLDEVAKDGGASSRRQSACMYMVARFIVAKNFRLHKQVIKDVPDLYRPYYEKKIHDVMSTMKWIVYDEFHRTSFSPSVRNQVVIDIREGRKWNLGVMLSSQSIDDFDATMKEFASGVFILNAGTHVNAEKLQSLFGFNDTSKHMLLNYANGPTAEGAPFLAQFQTKEGASNQFLMSSISPIEAWAFSTTAEDVILREKITEISDAPTARKILAKRFPGGSAKKEIERIKRTLTVEPGKETKGAIEILLEKIIDEDIARI